MDIGILMLDLVAVAAPIGLIVWLNQSSKAYTAMILAKAEKLPLPETFKPFSGKVVSLDDLVRFERLVKEVTPAIEQGKTQFTNTQFSTSVNYCRGYLRQSHFIRTHPILSVILLLCMIPMGFIPLIVYFIYLAVIFSSVSKMEAVFMAFYNGSLLVANPKASAVTPAGDFTNQLSKLHELLKSGALTQAEFDQQKKQILERAS